MLDLLGQTPELQYKGRDKHLTSCGVFLTYIFFGFAIWLTIYMGSEMFDRKEPQTNEYNEYFQNPEKFEYSPNTFYAAFGLQNPKTFDHYIDPSIYRVDAKLQIITKYYDPNGNIKNRFESISLAMTTCKQNFFGALEEGASELDLNNLLCIDPVQPSLNTIELTGKFESPLYQYITVDFYPCKNGTGVICKDQNTIDELLDGSYFAAYYADSSLDLKDYKKPKRGFIDSTFTTFGKSYYKEYQVYIKNIEIVSDIGFLTEDLASQRYQKFDKIQEIFDMRQFDNFFRFIMRVSPLKTFYFRKYMKVQDLLANLDGTLTFSLLALVIISLPYIQTKFYEGLINEIFDVSLYTSDENKFANANDLIKKIVKLKKKQTANFDFTKKKKKNAKKDKNDKAKIQMPNFLAAFGEKNVQETAKNLETEKNLVTSDRRFSFENRLTSGDEVNKQKVIEEQAKDNLDNICQNEADNFFKSDGASDNNNIELEIDKTPTKNQDKKFESRHTIAFPTNNISLFPKSNYASLKSSFTEQNLFNHKLFKNSYLDKKNADNHSIDVSEISSSTIKNSQELESPEMKRNEFNTTEEQKIVKEQTTEAKNANMLLNKEENDKSEDESDSSFEHIEEVFNGKKGINVTFIEYMRSFFTFDPALQKKMEMIKDGTKQINQRLDIFNIMKKMREIDKLKALLLDQDQLTLFNGLPKPVLDRESKKILLEKVSKTHATLAANKFVEEENEAVLKKAYETLAKRKNKSIVDMRLLAIFDGELM